MSAPLQHDPSTDQARQDAAPESISVIPVVAVSDVPPDARGFASVIRQGPFRRLWLAQISSQTSQNIIWWALVNQISSLTDRSPAAIGGISLMLLFPTILFAGLSGVLVDRFSKRSILILSNAMRALGCMGYVLLINNLVAIYAITFVVSVVNQPFQPAESATIPLLVNEKQLLPANALFQLTFMGSTVLGYTIGPLLVGLPFVGVARTLVLCCAFLVFAAVVLIPLPPVTRTRRTVSAEGLGQAAVHMWVELVEVAKVLMKDLEMAIALVQLSLAPAILLVLAQLGPKYVQQLLNASQANAMIILIAPAGAGLGLGLYVIERKGEQMPKGRVASWALVAIGLAIAALAVVPNVSAALLSGWHVNKTLGASIMTVPISFVLGVATSLLTAPAQTTVQERANSNLRGRVLAVQQALQAAVTIPPLLLVGAVGQVLTVSETLGIVSVVVIVAGIASRAFSI
jgi:MFS family permease